MKRLAWAAMWFVLSVFFMMGGGMSADKQAYPEALAAYVWAVCLMALSVAAQAGYFGRHRGGWPTYVGIGMAFLTLFAFCLKIGEQLWPTAPQPAAISWLGTILLALLSVHFLYLGWQRHLQNSLTSERGIQGRPVE